MSYFAARRASFTAVCDKNGYILTCPQGLANSVALPACKANSIAIITRTDFLVGGAGIRGGPAIGASDELGFRVVVVEYI
jgi:hypothetical protein